MKAILAGAGFGLVAMLAGCVPPPQYGMAPSPPAQQAEKSDTGLPEQPEFKPMPATDVRQMRCSALNSASDDDKAYASTFLLGYRSAMVHSHVLDTKQIDTIVQAAVAECAAKPEESAYRVFSTAQVKAAMAEHPPAHHVLHHRVTPAAAPATPAPPSTAPPLQYVPSPMTPMDQGSSSKPAEDKAATAPDRNAPPAPPWTGTAPAAAKPAESTPDAAKPAAADTSTSQPPVSTPAPTQPKPSDSAAPSSEGSHQ